MGDPQLVSGGSAWGPSDGGIGGGHRETPSWGGEHKGSLWEALKHSQGLHSRNPNGGVTGGLYGEPQHRVNRGNPKLGGARGTHRKNPSWGESTGGSLWVTLGRGPRGTTSTRVSMGDPSWGGDPHRRCPEGGHPPQMPSPAPLAAAILVSNARRPGSAGLMPGLPAQRAIMWERGCRRAPGLPAASAAPAGIPPRPGRHSGDHPCTHHHLPPPPERRAPTTLLQPGVGCRHPGEGGHHAPAGTTPALLSPQTSGEPGWGLRPPTLSWDTPRGTSPPASPTSRQTAMPALPGMPPPHAGTACSGEARLCRGWLGGGRGASAGGLKEDGAAGIPAQFPFLLLPPQLFLGPGGGRCRRAQQPQPPPRQPEGCSVRPWHAPAHCPGRDPHRSSPRQGPAQPPTVASPGEGRCRGRHPSYPSSYTKTPLQPPDTHPGTPDVSPSLVAPPVTSICRGEACYPGVVPPVPRPQCRSPSWLRGGDPVATATLRPRGRETKFAGATGHKEGGQGHHGGRTPCAGTAHGTAPGQGRPARGGLLVLPHLP